VLDEHTTYSITLYPTPKQYADYLHKHFSAVTSPLSKCLRECRVSARNDLAAPSPADDDDKKLNFASLLTSPVSTGDGRSTLSIRPLSNATTTRAAAAAAAVDGGADGVGGGDVIRRQSADEPKHQRTSSLDNSLVTKVR